MHLKNQKEKSLTGSYVEAKIALPFFFMHTNMIS